MTFALHFAAFLSGFLTMALEMVIGRMFIPYFGGTIYTWGALISVFLTGMTLGYLVGGKAADRRPDIRVISALFLLGTVTVVIVPMIGDQLINRILDSVEDMRYAALLASIALACIPAALFAAVSPYCVRLSLNHADRSGTISGRLSGLATAGSIIGTLGTSFFLIPNIGVRAIYGALGLVSGITGLVFLLLYWRRGPVPAGQVVSAIAAVALALLLICPAAPLLAQPPTLLMQKDGLIERVESEYNTILVEKRASFVSLNFGYRRNRYTESVIDLLNKNDLVVTYTRYMTAVLAYHDGPVSKVALVGLGGGRTITYLMENLPEANAEVAELDPEVIALAKKYFGVSSTDRLRIHGKDGRVFLNQTRNKFDVILLDAYRGPFVPFHLTTEEFYLLAKRRLREGGIVAQNVEPSTMFFDSAYATMKSVFDQVDVLEADGNMVLVGYPGPRLADADLKRKAENAQKRLKLPYDLRDLVKARASPRISVDAKVLTDDFAPVEMLKTVKRHNEKRE